MHPYVSFFKLFTFLSLDEISKICSGNINEAKERLAYEVTAIIHGKEEADNALAGAKAAFGGEGDKSQMPTVEFSKAELDAGIGLLNLFTTAKLTASNGDARRLVQGNGAALNGNVITDVKYTVTKADLDSDGELVVRAGKKKFCRVIFK